MMLTAWRMSVRMDPELDPKVMAALADALIPLFDEETDCAVHFVGLRLEHDDPTDIDALRDNFSPRAVGFAPIAAPALRRLLHEIEHAEAFEVRFFNIDAGRIVIHLHGPDLTISTEAPQTLLMLTRAVMATEDDFETDWHENTAIHPQDTPTLRHDGLPLRQTASGS